MFKNIIQKLFKKENIILGRWGYVTCPKELNRKVYLANHDHCGPCGKIRLSNDNRINN